MIPEFPFLVLFFLHKTTFGNRQSPVMPARHYALRVPMPQVVQPAPEGNGSPKSENILIARHNLCSRTLLIATDVTVP